MPAATRLTRATGDCLRVDLRVDLRALFPATFRVLRFAAVFFRAGPRRAAVLVEVAVEARLLADLRPPVLRAPDLRTPALLVLLRVLLRAVFFPDAALLFRPLVPAVLRVDLRVVLRVDLRVVPLLADAFLAADLRDPRLVPVREPAALLELLRDDFLVAMLHSGRC